MRVSKVSGNVGAEICGIDLRRCDDKRTFAEIRHALNDHGVVFFRDQELTLDQYIEFGKRFGTLFINNSPSISALPRRPEVEEIRKEPDETSNIGDEWHVDQAHREKPCMGTILYGQEIPPFGGDTLYANTSAAYDRLPEELKDEIDGLEAVHSISFLIEQAMWRTGDPDGRFARALKKADATAVHPVVKVHPETGRKCIYVNPASTRNFVGRTREESLPLLNRLYRHVLLPEFGCRFRWKKGSIAFWDNRQVWHYASNDYHGMRRVLYRLVVQTPPANGVAAHRAG